jgi:uncharacterized protein
MAKDYLPVQVNPFRFAENAKELRGTLLLKNMQRLLPSLMAEAGEVEVAMQFGTDQQGVRFLKAHYVTDVTLQCQRCMEAFHYGINNEVLAGLVATEAEGNTLPEAYDALIVEGNNLILADIIEEELIISLPIVPMHAPEQCKMKTPIIIANCIDEEITKEHPFKIIESLKAKPKKES